MATEFAGEIECYETWNEVSFPHDADLNARSPDGGGAPQFYSGTVDQLVALQRAAFEEIRAADPKACVLSPSFHSSGNWFGKLDRFLQAGGGKWVDRVSFHFYTGEHPPERIRFYADSIRAVLSQHGYGNLEIWNTESGEVFQARPGQLPTELSDEVHGLMLRHYLVALGSGIRRVYWYSWDHGEGHGLHRKSRNAGPVVEEAARRTVAFLRGVESVSCSDGGGELWRCTLRWSDGMEREVAWAVAASNGRVGLHRPELSWRLWGRPVTEAPVAVTHKMDKRPLISEPLRVR